MARLFGLILAAVLGAAAFYVPAAHAACADNYCDTVGEAIPYAHAKADARAASENAQPFVDPANPYQACSNEWVTDDWTGKKVVVYGWPRNDLSNCSSVQGGSFAITIGFGQSICGDGSVYDPATGSCPPPNPCKITDAPLGPQSSMTGNTVCKDGCAYQADVDNGPYISFGGPTFAKRWGPTGQQCTNQPPPEPFDPNKPICHSVGTKGATECVDPTNNRHCVNFASGAQHCWGDGETGPRSTQDGKDASDREKAPTLPTPPTNIENPTPNGTSTTTINNNTYNTTNYSGTGNTGGQSESGTGGKDPSNPDDKGDSGSASGGQCGTPYTCTGDNVMCAVLQEQFRARCAADEAGQGAGDGEASGAEGNLGEGIGKLVGAPESTNVLDVLGDRLSSPKQCPQDPQIEAFGRTITLPLSSVCPYLQLVGTLLLAFTYLAVVRAMLK